MLVVKVKIKNQLGLHVRVCSRLVALSNKYLSIISLKYKDKTVDAKRIIEVMSLGAVFGDEIEIIAAGDDEIAAINALKVEFDKGFGET